MVWSIRISKFYRNSSSTGIVVRYSIHAIEMETASDSLHDVRGCKNVVKNLAAHDFKLLYK
jgi:hypothetical protein